MNIALATVALGHGSLFPPCDTTGLEQPFAGDLAQVVVTGRRALARRRSRVR